MIPKVIEDKSDGCGICEEICPVKAIQVEGIAKIDEAECLECNLCVEACPNEAIVTESYMEAV